MPTHPANFNAGWLERSAAIGSPRLIAGRAGIGNEIIPRPRQYKPSVA